MGELEKKVLVKCMGYLDTWYRKGVVVHYDRFNSGMSMVNGRYVKLAEEGTPDIIAYVKVSHLAGDGAMCWAYFIECKREGGGDWRPSQRIFCDKFKGLSNVIYELVDDPKQINKTIETLTGFEQKKLDAIEFMEDV